MRVLSIGYFLPYEGVPHAGGEYYLRHVRALLQAGHEVTIVAPATASNTGVDGPTGVRVVLVPERRDLLARTAGVFARLFRHAVLPPRFTIAALSDARVLRLLREADLVEYQWVPASSLHKRLQARAGVSRPAVCVAHDVVSQSLQRLADQPGIPCPERILRRVRVRIGRWDEGRQLRRMDLVTTFSDKDRLLLEEDGIRSAVVLPPLAGREPRVGEVDRSVTGHRLLFVGAFDRLENVDAAEWLLDDIWPIVTRACSDAVLQLVGASPTKSMLQRAEDDSRIEVTGYVEDLDSIYESATLVVVPLRLGAGVKFKVITALLNGLPIVTTSVGAEGVARRSEEVFVAVEDDAESFARAIIGHLRDTGPGLRLAEAARERAEALYGWTTFRERLDDLYGGISRPAPSELMQ